MHRRSPRPANPGSRLTMPLRRIAMASALVVVLAGTAVPAAAEVALHAQPAHAAAARDLLRLLRVEDSVAPMVAQVSLLLTEQIQQWNAPEDKQGEVEKTIARMNEALGEEFSWRNLESDYVVLYTETFTETELKEIARFFRSGAGAKYIASVPGIQQRTMNIAELRMARVQPRIELLLGDLKRHLDVTDLERNPATPGAAPAADAHQGGTPPRG